VIQQVPVDTSWKRGKEEDMPPWLLASARHLYRHLYHVPCIDGANKKLINDSLEKAQ
jgi:hypothetical protein